MQSNTKLRMTRQRQIVLEELKRSKTHPTADEVYEKVRKRIPRISMGTVYRNLEILATRGVINKIEGSPMRFDGCVEDHYHVRCKYCSKISDVQSDGRAIYKAVNKELSGWEIIGYEFELLGICPQCGEKS